MSSMESMIRTLLFSSLFHALGSQIANFDRYERDLSSRNRNVNGTHSNVCLKIDKYEDKENYTYYYNYEEPYTGWCFSIPPRCTKYRSKTKVGTKTINVFKTRTVFGCCEGYEKRNDICVAVCQDGCVNGKCQATNDCSCDPGWKGVNCTKECETGSYGKGCEMNCHCNHGATCDKKNGSCHCPPGYTGTFCESACPGQLYGKNCENECKCMNGASCDLTDGRCECTPGYFGIHCENQCEVGTYGKNCSNICSCNPDTTELCIHINGKCQCVPGWRGDRCGKTCESNTWGPRCERECDCGPNGTCHHVSGMCSCPPGWHGLNCLEKCPAGFFEKDCKMKCPECLHEPGTCHHESGWCNCPPGARGQLCDLECPEGKYGTSCKEVCLCINNSTCDAVTGNCSCDPGWTGIDCSLPCPEGTFGLHCMSECNCSNNSTCDSTDGNCLCEGDTKEEICREELWIQETDSSFVLLVVLGAFILLGIMLFLCLAIFIYKKKILCRKEEYREETSTTNVFEEDNSPNINRHHFVNLTYDAAETLESSSKQFMAEVISTNGPSKDLCDINKRNSLGEEHFGIPECDPVSSVENPRVEIYFGNDFKVIDSKTVLVVDPTIEYSKSAGDLYVNQFENTSFGSAIYADVDIVEEHEYEKPNEIIK